MRIAKEKQEGISLMIKDILAFSGAATSRPQQVQPQKRTMHSLLKVSNDHLRMLRIALRAPMPLLAMSIFLMAWSPPDQTTNSSTVLNILGLANEIYNNSSIIYWEESQYCRSWAEFPSCLLWQENVTEDKVGQLLPRVIRPWNLRRRGFGMSGVRLRTNWFRKSKHSFFTQRQREDS